MENFIMEDHPHRRFNPLTREWILVSPHRAKRPWQGQTEKVPGDSRPQHDPGCYLCPGNERAGGIKNPVYSGVYSFTNDFSALLYNSPGGKLKTLYTQECIPLPMISVPCFIIHREVN